jgi:hypothetical protein
LQAPPLVSIIINNYNYARFLPDAIDSALAQSYPHVEVIVVDDGSTDHSREVLRNYADRVVPLIKANGGQASALNAGLRQSRGDIVFFLDADDRLLPTIARSVVDVFQSQPNVAKVMYRMEVIDAHAIPTGAIKPPPHLRLRSGDLSRHVLTFPFDMTWTPTSGNAFAASVLQRIYPVPEEDYRILADFYLAHIAPLFGPVTFLEEIGAQYRVHDQNHHEAAAGTINLPQIRQMVAYAERTCVHIKRVADHLVLEASPKQASDLYSVSLLSKRLTLLKLDRPSHPAADDAPWRLALQGIAAARRRFDVAWPLKALYGAWFVAMLLAPRPLAYRLAIEIAMPDRRRWLNPLLRTLHLPSHD